MPGHGPYTFAECCQLCCGIDMDTEIAMESGGGGSGHSEEGERGHHRIQAPAWVRGTESRPTSPRYLFSIYWGQKRSPSGWGRTFSSPFLACPGRSTPLYLLSFSCATLTHGWGRAQLWLKRTPIPEDSWATRRPRLCRASLRLPVHLLLQVMGVNNSSWVDGGGELLQSSATQATATLGFHLANKHWLWD